MWNLRAKKCKVSYRKIWRSYIVYQRIRLLNPETTRQRSEMSKRRAARTSAKRGICFRIPTLYRCSKWQSVWNLKRMRANLHPSQAGSHNRGGDAWSWTFKAIAWKKNMRHLGIINFYSRDYASRVGASFLFCTIIFHWKECNFI